MSTTTTTAGSSEVKHPEGDAECPLLAFRIVRQFAP